MLTDQVSFAIFYGQRRKDGGQMNQQIIKGGKRNQGFGLEIQTKQTHTSKTSQIFTLPIELFKVA